MEKNRNRMIFPGNLKKKLESHYHAFDRSTISPDPLQFLHLYGSPADIEAAGIISAVFAYGSVSQIINTVEKIHAAADRKPSVFIKDFSSGSAEMLKGIKHRFYTNADIITFFSALKKVYEEYGSIKNFFIKYYDREDDNIRRVIEGSALEFYKITSKHLGREVTPGLKFMFPVPAKGSACKRTNLFLRWMVRRDELDFGIWDEISTSKLLIPVDTHIARICRSLKLTARSNPGWEMAVEITENLKQFDPIDPVKYDFAICHIGMRKLKF